MHMSLCHGGVLVEHECVCESRRIRVRRVGACRTIIESGREREFVPPQPLVVWGYNHVRGVCRDVVHQFDGFDRVLGESGVRGADSCG
jgi:hypothetical protein